MLVAFEETGREDALATLEAFIVAGKYSPGDRLPSERELIVKLDMTRTRLRQALDTLEHEGKIWRHVGKGTFLVSAGVDRLADITLQVSPAQMMRARFLLEPALAQEAAMNATAEDLARIKLNRDRAREASSWDDYEARDDLLHRSMAEATGNILLLSIFDRLNQVRRTVAWNTVIRESPSPPANHPSFSEHDRIVNAIDMRNPVLAHAAMRDHLVSVSARLFGEACVWAA